MRRHCRLPAAALGALAAALPAAAAAQDAAPARPGIAYCLAIGFGEGTPAAAADAAVVNVQRRLTAVQVDADIRGDATGFRIIGRRDIDRDLATRLATVPGDFAIYRVDDDPPEPALGQDLPDRRVLPNANDPPGLDRVFLPPLFTTADVVDADAAVDLGGTPLIDIRFTEAAAVRLAEVTAGMVGERVAVAYEGVSISAPVVVGPVEGGVARISGAFDDEGAAEIAAVLKAGRLPAPLELIAELPPADCIEGAPPAAGAAPPN